MAIIGKFSTLACGLICFSLPLFAGFVINPVFDSTITSDPNAATIESTINAAIQVYENTFLDNITVKLEFHEMTTGLGSSQTFVGQVPYATYVALLTGDQTSADDATALASLPGTLANTNVFVTSANLRALGVSAAPPGGQADSSIGLKTSIMNLDRNSIDANKYDLFAVVSHEIDEALGFGTELNGLANGASVQSGLIWGLDLYRYDQNGNRSLNTQSAALAYFSINSGATTLAQFNQDGGGDYSDFFSIGAHTPQVQDAYATPGSTPNLGVEIRALDVLGYDTATPEPGTAILLGLGGLMALGGRVVKRKK